MALWNKEITINAPIYAIINGFTSGIQTTQDGQIIDIANAEEVRRYFDTVYHTFAFPYYTQSELTSLTPITSKLSETWGYFLGQMQENIDRVYKAYNVEYAPLDNYDKRSTITTEMSGTETDTTSTNSNSTSNYGAQHSTSKSEVSPDTSETYYNTERVTADASNYSDTNSGSNSGTNTRSFNDRKDTITEYTHGNIGVTTNAQMLTGEIDVRKLRYIKWVCDEFALNNFVSMSDDERRG